MIKRIQTFLDNIDENSYRRMAAEVAHLGAVGFWAADSYTKEVAAEMEKEIGITRFEAMTTLKSRIMDIALAEFAREHYIRPETKKS